MRKGPMTNGEATMFVIKMLFLAAFLIALANQA